MKENIENKKDQNGKNLEFLLEEFKQCYEHMRHYDNIKLSLSKFAFSFYSTIATIVFALERYFYIEKSLNSVHLFLSGLLGLTFIIGIMLIYMLTQNRLYFVRVARQTNHIRGTFLSRLNFNFEGLLSADKSKPYPLNFKSTHLFLILLFILINSIVLGFALAFGLFYFGLSKNVIISFSFVISLVSSILLIFFTKNKLSKPEEI